MDYLAYGYLQTGQDAEAERILAQLNSIRRADPPIFTVAYAATAIPARLVLERRRWREAASLELQDNVRNLAPLNDFKWGEAHVHFARAVGAARSGNAEAARAETAKLKTIEVALAVPAGSYDWRKPVAVERQIAEAWVAAAEGRKEDAVRLMRAAADLDDATEKHPVTPGAILPAREQLGELMLELGRGQEALIEYESALKRGPGRLASLYGAAKAARLIGDRAKAGTYFRQIVETTRDGNATRVEIAEARAFAAEHASR
jgi:tetratricopeptide (TPR) repeat protein